VPEVPVLGAVPRSPELVLPDRHLGLVQAREHPDLDAFLDRAAAVVGEAVDAAALIRLARQCALAAAIGPPPLPPLGQRIAVAADLAFAFAYPLLLTAWRRAGAEICPFSPLAGEAPDATADAVYLPGGYPELHAERLAATAAWREGLAAAAARGAALYGECGGYMALGRGLVDAAGRRHAMAGLLPLETSFASRRLHLGYRQLRAVTGTPLGAVGSRYRGHEFHYALVLAEGDGQALFDAGDALGRGLGPCGRRSGSVFGSFVHLIDAVTTP
jgi:cobyrinic acid a,c-diamide synthase